MVSKKDKFLATAQKLLERGSLDKALAEFLKAAGEDPKDTRTWLKIAEIHVKRGARPDAIDVYLRTADLYTEQGFFQRAVAVYKNILKLSPGYVQAHFKLAELFKQLGLLSDAMQQYEQAAQVYGKSGKAKEALDAMRQIVELNPEHAPSRIKLAEAAANAGILDEAARELRRAADQLKAAGKVDEYLRVGERLSTLRPDDLPLAKELASAYLERNNARFALAKLQPCFAADPKDLDTLTLLVRSFEQLGQVPKTLSVLRELQKVYGELGRTTERRDIFKKILALDPNDLDAREAVSRDARASSTALPVIRVGASGQPERMRNAPASSAAITFSEMKIPDFLLQPQTQRENTGAFRVPGLPDATTTQERIAFAAANLDRTQDDKAAEIQRIMSEVETFAKYGLTDRAAAHVRKVFLVSPANVPARERLADLLMELGRNAEAAREWEALAELVQPTNSTAADEYRRRALEADPNPQPMDPNAYIDVPITGAEQGATVARTQADDVSGELLDEAELLDEDDELDQRPTGHHVGPAARASVASPPPLAVMQPAPIGALPSARPAGEMSDSIELDLDPGGFGALDPIEPPPRTLISDTLESDAVTPGPEVLSDASTSRDGFDDDFAHAPRTNAEAYSEAALAADLEQVEFFLQQGMPEDAIVLLDDLSHRYPDHQGIRERRAQLLAVSQGAILHGALPEKPITGSSPRDSGGEAAPRAVVAVGGAGSDAGTRGDLGIAYKEMGLHDAAIREFRALAQDPKREVFALTMMGECYEAKGTLADAVIQYKKALNRPMVTDAEATQLYFLLGNVFEALGDRKEALYFFEKVAKRDATFRDVKKRVAALKGVPTTNTGIAPVPSEDADALNAAFDAILGGGKRS